MAPRNRGASWGLTRSAHAAGKSVDAGMVRRQRPRRGRRPLHGQQHAVRNPGGPVSGLERARQVHTVPPRGPTVRHGWRASARFRGPTQPAPKGRPMEPAEQGAGRERAKGNVAEPTRSRTQRRGLLSQALGRGRQGPPGAYTSDPRQEPGAGKPHAGICAEGAGELASLPRPSGSGSLFDTSSKA
jgi:hypothetical protein